MNNEFLAAYLSKVEILVIFRPFFIVCDIFTTKNSIFLLIFKNTSGFKLNHKIYEQFHKIPTNYIVFNVAIEQL